MHKAFLRSLVSILALGLIFGFCVPFCFADESMTITSYYPSPYGVYRELRSQRMAIGDDYIQGGTYDWEVTDGDGGEIDYQADLVVQGNVGIGTTTPAATFSVVNTGSNIPMTLDSYASGNNIRQRGANGTPASPTQTLSGNVIGSNTFWGWGATGFGSAAVAAMKAVAAQNFTDSNKGTYLTFLTTPLNSVTQAEAMRIDTTGNVGIKTVSPGANLEVNNTIRLTPTDSPSYAVQGALYYSSSANNIKYHDGSSWRTMGGSDVVYVSASAGGSTSWIASCPADHPHVTGGGQYSADLDEDSYYGSYPEGGNSWHCVNMDPNSAICYAVCMN